MRSCRKGSAFLQEFKKQKENPKLARLPLERLWSVWQQEGARHKSKGKQNAVALTMSRRDKGTAELPAI